MRNKSISTRFNLALGAIVAIVMVAFALIATVFTTGRISDDLDAKLENYLRISTVGLEAPLWNFDNPVVEGYLDSLMLDEEVALVSVLSGDGTVITRATGEIGDLSFEDLAGSDDFVAGSAAVTREGTEIGRIDLVVSRAAVRQEIGATIIAIAVLTLFFLATIAVASIIISQRYIADPLSRLQQSADAIAGGELDVMVDTSGQDEIGALARAFDGMRSAIRRLVGELKDTNQNLEVRVEQRTEEVLAAQEKLVDAIESTSEGFSFFDADDRLVLYNTQYQKLLYGGTGLDIQAGMAFEDIVRQGIEKGVIALGEEDADSYVRRRVAQHRNPNGPFIQQRGDRRWIQISERKTRDGGTVAVFSDISELKNREADLTEKSAALENLSNQLAKYLSPQIYESIFEGRQEVRVTSTRKKLTVFFSDIEAFTETAEQMESEELTGLLNSYLTEMSKIALEHGATIDKYVGDAILIFFGDPESQGVKQDALACVNMAVAMAERMAELQEIWRNEGILRPLQCRMGIHTDYCTVGNFGSESRMDYTIVGRGVNTAARLESAAEPGKILISYATHAQVAEEVPCVARGKVEVKGIAEPLEVFEVVTDERDKAAAMLSEPAEDALQMDLAALSSAEREKFKGLVQDLLHRLSGPSA